MIQIYKYSVIYLSSYSYHIVKYQQYKFVSIQLKIKLKGTDILTKVVVYETESKLMQLC